MYVPALPGDSCVNGFVNGPSPMYWFFINILVEYKSFDAIKAFHMLASFSFTQFHCCSEYPIMICSEVSGINVEVIYRIFPWRIMSDNKLSAILFVNSDDIHAII